MYSSLECGAKIKSKQMLGALYRACRGTLWLVLTSLRPSDRSLHTSCCEGHDSSADSVTTRRSPVEQAIGYNRQGAALR
jgi:hypothetical protein